MTRHVFDAHRILGPIPTDSVDEETESGLLARLDHLGIAAAAVTYSAGVYGDGARSDPGSVTSDRLVEIPVVIPSAHGAGTTAAMPAAPAVRLCPVRHRFDLSSPSARACLSECIERRMPVVVDVSECGLGEVARLAGDHPGLRIFGVAAGYRELRRSAELLAAFPEVYLETGTIAAAGAIEWLVSRFGAQRLVFGTGAPEFDDAGPRFQLEHLRLSDADIDLIAFGSWHRMTSGAVS